MTKEIVLIAGVSGVGKSTLLRNALGPLRFNHIEASALIRDEMKLRQKVTSQDELRKLDIADNQKILVTAFKRLTSGMDGLVLVDGHTTIDTGTDFVDVDSRVFDEMNVSMIIFVADKPDIIADRRARDHSRNRPARSSDEIRFYQDRALISALSIALDIAVPLHVILPEERLLSMMLKERQFTASST